MFAYASGLAPSSPGTTWPGVAARPAAGHGQAIDPAFVGLGA
jgi:hypothetical protein